MRRSGTRSLFPGWSLPIRGIPARWVVPLRWLALLPRLYAGLTFIPYGYDKVLGGNTAFGMDADFFRQAGVPFPEVAQVVIGALELFGGGLLLVGFLTRVWAALLAADMVVAMILVGNIRAELPLLAACVVLIVLGGGMLSGDVLLEY